MAGYRGLTHNKVTSKASSRLKRDSKDALPYWYPFLGAGVFALVVFSMVISAGSSQDDTADLLVEPNQETLAPVFGNSSSATEDTGALDTAPATTDSLTQTQPTDPTPPLETPAETTVPDTPVTPSMVALPRLNGGTLDVPADAVLAALTWAEENGLTTSSQPKAVLTGPTTVILNLSVDTGGTNEGFNVAVALEADAWVVQ